MATPSLDVLTPREREILIRIAEGDSLSEIAQDLNRSLKTIETHRLSLGRKLGAGNRVELARIAIASGLVQVGPDTDEAPRQPAAPSHFHWIEHINEQIGTATGSIYLRRLIDTVCKACAMRFAGICLPDPTDGLPRFKGHTMSERGVMCDPVNYQLSATPCEVTVAQGINVVPDRVADAYPKDLMLREINARAYAGVRFNRDDDGLLGIMWIVDDKPFEHPDAVESVLSFFAPRTGAELARVQRFDELAVQAEALESQVAAQSVELAALSTRLHGMTDCCRATADHVEDALLVLGEDRRVVYANQALVEAAGIEREALIGKPAEALLTEAGRATVRGLQEDGGPGRVSQARAQIKLPAGAIQAILIGPPAPLDGKGDLSVLQSDK